MPISFIGPSLVTQLTVRLARFLLKRMRSGGCRAGMAGERPGRCGGSAERERRNAKNKPVHRRC
jgi:hypothetical protein